MFLHKISPPRPPSPDFVRVIDSTVSATPSQIKLHFYVPGGVAPHLAHARGPPLPPRRQLPRRRLHAGLRDRRRALVQSRRRARRRRRRLGRLPPRAGAPLPGGGRGRRRRLLHLARGAAEWGIDVQRIALTGFSSGANMCFTVPLRLQQELELEAAEGEARRASVVSGLRPPLQKALSRGRVVSASDMRIAVKAVVAWYPPVDYTRSRAERRATARRLDQQLPQIFTDLFDESYLQPPTMDMAHPFLSPGAAPRHMLSGLPEELVVLACEWDMLLDETERFVARLRDEVGKTVHFTVVEGVPHGFDKAPNPFRQPPQIAEVYAEACEQLKRLLA